MTNNRSLFVLILMIIAFTSGCSTYRVYDSYDIDDGRVKLSYRSDDTEAWVRVRDENSFGSIGILGMPVLPIYIKLADETAITIESTLTLRKEHEFFINTRPCLMLDATNKICANDLIVDAVALYRDDGTMYPDGKQRSNKVPEFDWRNKLTITSGGENKTGQIGRDEIYAHYGYKKQPIWDYLKITFTHNFLCLEKCPEKFTLDANGFLTVNSIKIINAEYPYQKKRHYDYKFVTSL